MANLCSVILCLHVLSFVSFIWLSSIYITAIDVHARTVRGERPVSGFDILIDPDRTIESGKSYVMMNVYSRDELIALRNVSTKPRDELWCVAKELGIARRFRGRRAGRNVHRPIKTRISDRTANCNNPNLAYPSRTLVPIPRKQNEQFKGAFPSVFLTNVRSMNNKADELFATANAFQADIIGVTETWFGTSNPASANQLEGRVLFHQDRTDRRGGGVALYVRNKLNPAIFGSDLVPSHLEILWVKASLQHYMKGKRDIFISVVYSPPRSPLQHDLINNIIFIGDHIRCRYPDASLVVIGDFNDLDTSQFARHLNVSQMVKTNTRNNRILDWCLRIALRITEKLLSRHQ